MLHQNAKLDEHSHTTTLERSVITLAHFSQPNAQVYDPDSNLRAEVLSVAVYLTHNLIVLHFQWFLNAALQSNLPLNNTYVCVHILVHETCYSDRQACALRRVSSKLSSFKSCSGLMRVRIEHFHRQQGFRCCSLQDRP